MGLMQGSSLRRRSSGDQQRKKRGPTIRTPIPLTARPILERVHYRYMAACKRGERPAIDDPRCVVALLTLDECVTLAECGYYPIPPEIIKLGGPPKEHRREQQLDLIREILARDMPAVFDLLAQERGLLP